MAKLQRTVHGDFDQILGRLDNAILNGSISATFEDGSDYRSGDFRSVLRVYERYSWTGGNRVSMALSLAGASGSYLLSVITSGGSQAMFWKFNTFGEQGFLDTIAKVVEDFP